MSSNTIFDVGTGVLNAATAALTCTDNTPPAVRYVTLARPPVDCEMLVVYPVGVAPAFTTTNRNICARVPLITFIVEVWRCVYSSEDGYIPSVDEQVRAAAQVSRDGWLLWADMSEKRVYDSVEAILRVEGEPSVCYNIELGELEFIPTQGGYSGVRYGVRVEADGYGCEV